MISYKRYRPLVSRPKAKITPYHLFNLNSLCLIVSAVSRLLLSLLEYSMSNIKTSDLVFPNGRPVTKVKMDAKKLKKAQNIKLNQAQNLCARANGLDLDWDAAIVFLKKQATAKHEEELSTLAPQVTNSLTIERKHNVDAKYDTQSPNDFGKIFEAEPADLNLDDIVKSSRSVITYEKPTEHFFTPNPNDERSSLRSSDLEVLHMLTTGSGVKRVKPSNEKVTSQSKIEKMAFSLNKYTVGLITLFNDGTLIYDPKADSLPFSGLGGMDTVSFEDLARSLIERGIMIKGSEPRTGLTALQTHDAKQYKAMCDELGAAIVHKIQQLV